MEIVVVFVAFVLGVFVERVYLARWKGITRLGASWGWSGNGFFRWLHRIYCELCPRRIGCERYWKEVAK
ncbi:MAG: hypothetical protein JSV05_09655 [Candidatus Bathyarchaeota archaeon]|nr:MAG: hypothetical protein JSV05_09655 [Candidatus Bathyarchaeota archaeon]